MNEYIYRFLNYILVVKQYSKNTYFAYKNDLEEFFSIIGEKKPYEISTDDIGKYINELQKKEISSFSLARKFSSLNSFFKFLLKDGLIEFSPMYIFDYPQTKKHVPDFLTFEEIEKFLNSIETKTKSGIRDKALFEFMYSTGVRVSEVINLKLSSINFEKKYAIISGKGKKDRIVPFGEKCDFYLKKYIYEARDNFLKYLNNLSQIEYLFLSNRGKKLSRITIWKNMQKYGRISGIEKKLYPHILRHTFATHLIFNGANIRFVQELLGHSSITTTEIYTHTDLNYLVSNYKKFYHR